MKTFQHYFLATPESFSASGALKDVWELVKAKTEMVLDYASVPNVVKHIGSTRSKVGIAIITRLPLPDRSSAPNNTDHPAPLYLSGLRNLHLLERILTERVASSIYNWCYNRTFRLNSVCNLFLIYKQTYTSAYSLHKWLEKVPTFSASNASEASQVKFIVLNLNAS